MGTARAMREAIVATDIDRAWLHGGMGWIQAYPVSAEMAEMPCFVDEAILLFLGEGIEH